MPLLPRKPSYNPLQVLTERQRQKLVFVCRLGLRIDGEKTRPSLCFVRPEDITRDMADRPAPQILEEQLLKHDTYLRES